MKLTVAQLQAIMPQAKLVNIWVDVLNPVLGEFDIDTKPRIAGFLSQVAHETGQLRWLREIWGPTAQQLKYDPPNALAKRLGNTQKGDGKRFRGGGLLQLTGRANYAACSAAIFGDDRLVRNPDIIEQRMTAARSAAWFWQKHGLNELADDHSVTRLTKIINGGKTGLNERMAFHGRALLALYGDKA